MRSALESIHSSGDYPFLHAALVADQNSDAYNRLLNDYNFAGYPSCFIDGGYRVSVGGWDGVEAVLRSHIEQSGARAVPSLDLITALDWLGSGNVEVHVRIGNGVPANQAPANPPAPSGETQCLPDVSYEFEASTSDPDGDELYYQWDWGDTQMSGWIGPIASGGTCTESHSWTDPGAYDVKVRAKDLWGEVTAWSPPLVVNLGGCCAGIRGNIDGDEFDQINIADLVYLVDYSFSQPPGPEPPCFEEADVNGDGNLNIADVVYLVDYMFSQPPGPPPASCI